ncbi:unnamed protein product [Prorocentrum cordatum]|uniref:Uncharacterized protein n=1 Tax=Prorocentrum cordatum TaxID=2364126 RepID=A0ABN9SA75_9DINO|nr:unnamed protein product [Polarella glacialis]
MPTSRTFSQNPYNQLAVQNSMLADGLVAVHRRQGPGRPGRRARATKSEGPLLPQFGQVAGWVPDQARGQELQPRSPARKVWSAPAPVPALAGQGGPEVQQRCGHEGAARRSRHAASSMQAAVRSAKQESPTIDGSVPTTAQPDITKVCDEGREDGTVVLGTPTNQESHAVEDHLSRAVAPEISKAQPHLAFDRAASACSTEPPDAREKVRPILAFSASGQEEEEEEADCNSPKSVASTICDHWGMTRATPADTKAGDDATLALGDLRQRVWRPSLKNADCCLLQPSTEVTIFGTGSDLDGVRGTITIVDAAEGLYRVRLPNGSQRKIMAGLCRVVDPYS